jgi:acetylornithine deacetylase/succinyl-diaminopimelate desuccinylase-like protein
MPTRTTIPPSSERCLYLRQRRRSLAAATLLFLHFVASESRAASAPEVGWLLDYVRIDSSQPAGEARAAAYLAELLHRAGVTTERLVGPEGHTSLYARLRGQDPKAGALLLLHHLDVVGAGEGWTVPPFSGEVRDGRLWGRGTLDCKGLGIAQLSAFLALADRKVPLPRDVVFLAVGAEERGGSHGAGWIWERHPQLLEDVAFVLNEGGSARKVNGRLLFWEVEVAQKRPLWLEVETAGRGGHAAGLNPTSASHQLITALARLLALPPRYRVTDAARQFFGALAPTHGDLWRPIFSDLDAVVRPDGFSAPMLPGMPNLFLDTVQVTVLEASDQINVVAPKARAQIDVRLLPDTDADAFLAELERTLGPEVTVRVLLTSPPAPPSPTSGPAWDALVETLGREAPVVPAFKPGFTDSRWFRARGIAAYGITPFAIESTETGGIHGADEKIPLPEFLHGVERTRRLVETLLAEHRN